jgi:hypothetical protein
LHGDAHGGERASVVQRRLSSNDGVSNETKHRERGSSELGGEIAVFEARDGASVSPPRVESLEVVADERGVPRVGHGRRGRGRRASCGRQRLRVFARVDGHGDPLLHIQGNRGLNDDILRQVVVVVVVMLMMVSGSGDWW